MMFEDDEFEAFKFKCNGIRWSNNNNFFKISAKYTQKNFHELCI
jgi:hypothetical protein